MNNTIGSIQVNTKTCIFTFILLQGVLDNHSFHNQYSDNLESTVLFVHCAYLYHHFLYIKLNVLNHKKKYFEIEVWKILKSQD